MVIKTTKPGVGELITWSAQPVKKETEYEEKIYEMEDDMANDLDDETLTQEEREEIIESYQDDINEIKERIAELKEELE